MYGTPQTYFVVLVFSLVNTRGQKRTSGTKTKHVYVCDPGGPGAEPPVKSTFAVAGSPGKFNFIACFFLVLVCFFGPRVVPPGLRMAYGLMIFAD